MNTNLRAPNVWLFTVAAVLALIGIAQQLSIVPYIPGVSTASATWLIFLGWFLLAIANVLPERA
jgi:hypothetical protein